MIPIRDTIQSRNYPVVNNLIIATNGLAYLLELAQGQGIHKFILAYGLVPARYSIPEVGAYFTFGQQVFSLFSFMFIHGGFWHLLGNMWSLYIFGDNVEDRLGSFRYLLFYLLCGLASGASHLFINWHSQVPTIGASGAIAGVMGAYFLLYPKSRILTLIPLFFIPYFLELPAFFFLGIWFILQFLSAAGPHGQEGGIAWWAHIGGFVFGMVFLKLFLQIPESGFTQKLRRKTSRKKTHSLQAIRVSGTPSDSNLYGSIIITPMEARLGTRKLVNIPLGHQKRLFRVTVPPDVRQGTHLRLAGMGRRMDGVRGDLFLKVVIQGNG
jgi:membrane associated rhomboid family serine protease